MTRRQLMSMTLLGLLLGAAAVSAQQPMQTPVGPVIVPTASFTPAPVPTAAPTPESDDPRLVVCRAPFQPGFVPHIVRPGDRLADLLAGADALTVTQIAALNCLDDPGALPVGAVIWLPPGGPGAWPSAPDDTFAGTRARITGLAASTDRVQNTAQVFFNWQAEGEAAYFYTCPPDPDTPCVRPFDSPRLPVNFITPPVSGFSQAGTARYRLEVVGGGAAATRDIMLEVVCTHEALAVFAGMTACPHEPIYYYAAAWQPFEHGVMMWLADTGRIWVMTNDGRLRVFDDTYQEGDPDPQASPPPDRRTPRRGFGQVWQALGGADSPLGWALDDETGYDSARQAAGRVSYTRYVGAPGGTIYAVTLIPGSRDGYWARLDG